MGRKFFSRERSLRNASRELQKVEVNIPLSPSREAAKLRRRRLKRITKKGLDSKKEEDAVVVKAPPVKPVSILRNGNQAMKSRIYSDPPTVKQVSVMLPNGDLVYKSQINSDPSADDFFEPSAMTFGGFFEDEHSDSSDDDIFAPSIMTFGGFLEDKKMQDKPTGFFKQFDFSDDDSVGYKSAGSIAKDRSTDVFPVNELQGLPQHRRNDIGSTHNSVNSFADEKSQDKPTGFFEQLDFSDDDLVGYKSAASIAKDCSADVFTVKKLTRIPKHDGNDVGSMHNSVDSFADEKSQDKPTGFFEQLNFSDDDLASYKSAASIAKDCSADVLTVNKLPRIPKHHGNDVGSTHKSVNSFADEKSQDKPTGFFEQLDFSNEDLASYKSAASIAKDRSADVFTVNKLPGIPKYHVNDVGSTHNSVNSFADEKLQDKPKGFFQQFDFSDDDLAGYKSAASIATESSADVLIVSKLPGKHKHHGNNIGSTHAGFDSMHCNCFDDGAHEKLKGLFEQIRGCFADDEARDDSMCFFEQLDFSDDDEGQDSSTGYTTASSMAEDLSVKVFPVDKLPWTPKNETDSKRPSTPATVATSLSSNKNSKLYVISKLDDNSELYDDEEIGVEQTLDDLYITWVKLEEMEARNKIEEAMRRQMMTELKQQLVERKIHIDQQLAEMKIRQDLEELEQKIVEMKLQEEFDNWSFLQSMDDESMIEGLVSSSFDNELEKKTLKNDRLLKKGTCLAGGTSLGGSESLEGGAALGDGASLGNNAALADSASLADNEALEDGMVEVSLDKGSMRSRSMEEEDEEEEAEIVVPSGSAFSLMIGCGALEETVLCLDVPAEDDELSDEQEYEYYDDEDEYSDDGSGDDEINDEHEVDDSVYNSPLASQPLVRLEETEAPEANDDALEEELADQTDKDFSLFDLFGETNGMGFSDTEPVGSNQGTLFQSRDESPSKTDHRAIDLMKAQHSGKENTLVSEGNGLSQSTFHVRHVMDERNKHCFVTTESKEGFTDYWQHQSTENTETREDQSAARNGTERIARVIMESRPMTTREYAEHVRACIDKGDLHHWPSRISAEPSIDMLATIHSNDSMLKATQEWENFGSSPFGNSPFGTSSPFYDLEGVPTGEFY